MITWWKIDHGNRRKIEGNTPFTFKLILRREKKLKKEIFLTSAS